MKFRCEWKWFLVFDSSCYQYRDKKFHRKHLKMEFKEGIRKIKMNTTNISRYAGRNDTVALWNTKSISRVFEDIELQVSFLNIRFTYVQTQILILTTGCWQRSLKKFHSVKVTNSHVCPEFTQSSWNLYDIGKKGTCQIFSLKKTKNKNKTQKKNLSTFFLEKTKKLFLKSIFMKYETFI